MTIQEVYEKYKDMDHLFSNREWLMKIFDDCIIFDLWQAVKKEATKQPPATGAKGEA